MEAVSPAGVGGIPGSSLEITKLARMGDSPTDRTSEHHGARDLCHSYLPKIGFLSHVFSIQIATASPAPDSAAITRNVLPARCG